MIKRIPRPGTPRTYGARALLGLALALAVVITPNGVQADTSGGQASAYLAYRQSANSCAVWSPLYANGGDGWTSTMVVHNESTSGVTVDFHLRALIGGSLITRSISIPGSGTREVKPTDLSLPDGFIGSIAGTANPCGELSAVTYHDASGRNRISLESPEVASTVAVIPLVYNDYNGWSSLAIVQNTNRDQDAVLKVTYRGTDLPTVETSLTVRRDSGERIDFTGIPKGALTVEFENKSGTQGVVAAAYHVGPSGIADGNNAVAQSQGAGKVFIPLLFRKYNGYDSGVRVVNVREGGSQPRITFYDRDTTDRVATIVSPRTLREGEETTFYLPTIDLLQDNKVYSAVVETEGSSSDTLMALANHVNYARNTAMLYLGASRGDTNLTVPLVYRSSSGLSSGIQVQNLTGTQASVTVRFRNLVSTGTTVATETVTAFGNNSATIYLPAIANLPDNFVGFAEINSSVPIAATVNAIRYTSPAASPATGG
jgi:hypothetical protein